MPQNTPSRQEMIEAIRAKCVEANPEILIKPLRICSCPDCTATRLRPIRLADALLALKKRAATRNPSIGEMMKLIDRWLEAADSLDNQSDDCIRLLYDLIA